MTRFDLHNDEDLLTLLSEVLDEADPVPDAAMVAAKAIAGLGGVDAELAALVADTMLDDEVVLMRHDLTMEREQSDRMVSFTTPRISVDMEFQGDGQTVLGAITPAMSVEVNLETTTGTESSRSDDLGRFRLASGSGPCRLRIHAADGSIVTPWIMR